MTKEYGAMPSREPVPIDDYETMEELARQGYKFGGRRHVRQVMKMQKRKGAGYTRKMRKGRRT